MIVRLMCAASLLLAFAATAQQASPAVRDELPYGDCLRADQINEWNVIDDSTVTVRNGPHHFLVTTTVACPRMDVGGGLHLRLSESDKAIGGARLCGGIREEIVRRDDPPCPIQSIAPIDKDRFDALTKKAKRHGSGAEPNGPSR
jgi:hypothetical protein